jgi:hypothetical protein
LLEAGIYKNGLTLWCRVAASQLYIAVAMQTQAERQFTDNEYTVNSIDVLTLARQTGCSAYVCEFVSLAKALNLKLIT